MVMQTYHGGLDTLHVFDFNNNNSLESSLTLGWEDVCYDMVVSPNGKHICMLLTNVDTDDNCRQELYFLTNNGMKFSKQKIQLENGDNVRTKCSADLQFSADNNCVYVTSNNSITRYAVDGVNGKLKWTVTRNFVEPMRSSYVKLSPLNIIVSMEFAFALKEVHTLDDMDIEKATTAGIQFIQCLSLKGDETKKMISNGQSLEYVGKAWVVNNPYDYFISSVNGVDVSKTTLKNELGTYMDDHAEFEDISYDTEVVRDFLKYTNWNLQDAKEAALDFITNWYFDAEYILNKKILEVLSQSFRNNVKFLNIIL